MAPPELQEEVELFARKSNRTARLHFVPYGGWFARFELRSNDPVLRLYQEGKVGEPPTEDVFFHVKREQFNRKLHPCIPGHEPKPHNPRDFRAFIPLDILQLGRDGVRNFLEAGDTWSGRGVFNSQLDALKAAEAANLAQSQRGYRTARGSALDRGKDQLRYFKNAVVSVLSDIGKRKGD